MAVAERIREKLTQDFAPEAMELRDDSEKHRHHSGWREGGESHFHLTMVSASFQGQNRVARQRAVYAALKAEFDAGLHAMSMELRAPGE
ncbi:MAG: BolA family protein [Pseudomonadota bacterium]